MPPGVVPLISSVHDEAEKGETPVRERKRVSRNCTLLFEIMKLFGAGDVVFCEFTPQDALMVVASVDDIKKSVGS